jgi:hypothetical protein
LMPSSTSSVVDSAPNVLLMIGVLSFASSHFHAL